MIVGTAGHIDHGKTSLVRALTGVETDRLKEEKQRGITIDLGFAYMPAEDGGIIGFVDVPGHERFVRNMLAGATGIDFALLVVAADDGVMPQTREHLAIMDLLGVTRGVVALTKADLVDPDRLAAATNEAANLLIGTGLEGAEVVPVSSVTGMGVADLSDRLMEAARRPQRRAHEGGFRLAVDRCFTLKGAGTVVTGTALSGEVAVGDHLIVGPAGTPARVRGLHAQNRQAERGAAGDRCALNLAGEGIAKDAISRGDMVLDPSLHAPCERIDAWLKVLVSETRPVTQWMPVRFHHAASDLAARVVLLGEQPIRPGGEGFVQLVLERGIAAACGDRFVIRDTSAQRTVGGGMLLDLRAPSRRRRTPERLAQLEARRDADPETVLAALLEKPPRHIDLDGFRRDFALTGTQVEAMAERIGMVQIRARDRTIVVSQPTWQQLQRGVIAVVEKFHADNPDFAGIGLERLRTQVEPRLPGPTFSAALREMMGAGLVALDGPWVKLPGHEVRLTPRDEIMWEETEPLLGGTERFRPPRVRDIAATIDEREVDVRRLLKLMARLGRVDEVAHDHFFLRDTLAEMVEIAADLDAGAQDGQFTVAEFRDRLDNGRKVAIHILEFLDRHGVTFRRGDARRINPQRLDLFRRQDAEAQEEAGREASPVGRPDFKSGRGRQTVLGGFDPHSFPPKLSGSVR